MMDKVNKKLNKILSIIKKVKLTKRTYLKSLGTIKDNKIKKKKKKFRIKSKIKKHKIKKN